MAKNRAALYLRLSKEDGDKIDKNDDSASIINQRLLLTEYALSQGFEIAEVYQDEDFSGLFADRPGFEKLMVDAKLLKFDVVVAKSQSRFTRNMELVEQVLHNTFPLLGIRFIGVADNADTANKGNKKSRQINGLVNEWYCEDLSNNIKAVFENKMRNGQFLGSSCPYGYIKNPNKRNHLIVDDYAANIVRRIFEMYISGIGKTRIGATLSHEGILIPSVYKRDVLKQNYHNANALRTTSLWSFQTIHQILNNEVYIGHTVQNKCKTLSYKSKLKKAVPKDEWIKVENTHEPIIDTKTWNLAQEIGKHKTREVNAEQKVSTFSGKLYCNECGHSLSRKYNRKSDFVGYCCKTYKTHGKKFCTNHFIQNDELEEYVIEQIQNEARACLTDGKVDELMSIKLANNKTNEIKGTIKKLELQLEEIARYKKKSYENYVDGILSKQEFLDYKESYAKQEDEVKRSILQLQEKIKSDSNVDNRHKEWVDSFSKYVNIKKLERNVVLELIDKIIIYEDGSIKIKFKFSNPYNSKSELPQ